MDEGGEPIKGETEGYLVFKKPWPGMMRTVYGNHERFETTYFKKFPGCYCTGDGEWDSICALFLSGFWLNASLLGGYLRGVASSPGASVPNKPFLFPLQGKSIQI